MEMGPANGRKSVREATPDPEAEEDPVASTSQCQSHGEGTTPRQAGGDSERLQGYQYDEIHEDSHSDDDDGRPGQVSIPARSVGLRLPACV